MMTKIVGLLLPILPILSSTKIVGRKISNKFPLYPFFYKGGKKGESIFIVRKYQCSHEQLAFGLDLINDPPIEQVDDPSPVGCVFF